MIYLGISPSLWLKGRALALPDDDTAVLETGRPKGLPFM
jgi:hypothetical protein